MSRPRPGPRPPAWLAAILEYTWVALVRLGAAFSGIVVPPYPDTPAPRDAPERGHSPR